MTSALQNGLPAEVLHGLVNAAVMLVIIFLEIIAALTKSLTFPKASSDCHWVLTEGEGEGKEMLIRRRASYYGGRLNKPSKACYPSLSLP